MENCNNAGEVTGTSNDVGGVLGDNSRGTVKNCNNEGKVTGIDYIGGVLGSNSGSIKNCYNKGKVTGNGRVGGVVGFAYANTTMENCHNAGEVTGTSHYIGGVIGNSEVDATNCSNTGEVYGNTNVGGVLGFGSGTIENCNNEGKVTGADNVGGVIGASRETVSDSYNAGKVIGVSHVGGVSGNNWGTVQDSYNTGEIIGNYYLGGVVGYNSGTTKNCSNDGKIAGNYDVGGVVGWNISGATVENCYNTGEVSGSSYAGGVLGSNEGAAENCHSNGMVEGGVPLGGIAGDNIGSVNNCSYDKEIYEGDAVGKNSGTVEEVEGKTSKEFQESDLCTALGGHMGGLATCQKGKICIICGETYDDNLNSENHEKTSEDVCEQIPGNISKHYRTCTYDSEKYTEEHTFNSLTGVCEACGYQAEVSVRYYVNAHKQMHVYYDSFKSGFIDMLQKYENSALIMYTDVTIDKESDSLAITESEEAVLDLNGCTLNAAIKVNKGTFTIVSQRPEGSIKTAAGADAAILVEDQGVLNVEAGNISTIYCSSGTVNLSGDPVIQSLKKADTGEIYLVGELRKGTSIGLDNNNLGAVAVEGNSYTITESDAEKFYCTYETDGFKPVLEENQLIIKRDVSKAMMTLSEEEYVYTGSGNEPEVTVEFSDITASESTEEKKITLEKDTDYTISYSNNVNAGTAIVTIEGMGNYTGTLEQEFTIKKAGTAPQMPETAMNVASSCKKVGHITLPEGWVWQESSKELPLTVGVAVTATAVYNGTDKGNYETETLEISITRAVCEHETEIRNAKEATCKETGYTGDTYCIKCEETVTTGKVIEKLTTHTWDEGVTTKEATCAEAGEKTYTCTVCETTKTEEVAKKSHTGGSATCTKKAVCTSCQEEYGELDKKNHGETELKNVKEATCKEAGYTGDCYCKECGGKLSAGEVTEKLTTHTWDEGVLTKEATCTEAGEKTYTCTVCETTKTEEVAKKSHTGGKATCTKKAVCTRCQEEYGELDKKNHGETELKNEKEATCTEAGYTGDSYCKDCGEKVSAGEAISKLDHTWDDGVLTKEATCTEAGEKIYTCTVCETTKTEEVAKKSHTGGSATCTKRAVCTNCQEEYGELDKKNHGETELKNEKEATCKEEGYTGDSYCKDCGEKLSAGEVISKSDHTWDDGVVTKEATATEKGIKTYTCTVCQETKTEEIPATGEAVITKIPEEVTTPEIPKTEVTPTVTPTSTPTVTPVPTGQPSKEEQEAPKKGTVLTDKKSGGKYKILVSGTKNGTVEYVKPLSQKSTKANVPATVKINGITYKVVSIGKNAFKNHKAITKVTIGKNVKTIGANAFYGCKKLKTVSIGKNVTTIGDKAFYKCTALTKLTIPAKVKKIGKQSFYGCKKLKTITIKTTKLTKKNVGTKAFMGIHKKATIKVPKNKVKTYQKLLKTKGVSKTVKVKK